MIILKLQEVFHAYLNKFEIVVSHLFLNIFNVVILNLHWLISSLGMISHQENCSYFYSLD